MDVNNSSPIPSVGSNNKNMTYAVVGVAILLLVVAGGAYAFKNELKTLLMPNSSEQVTNPTPPPIAETPEPPAPTNEAPSVKDGAVTNSTSGGSAVQAVEVNYVAKEGFSPALVNVKKGTTVKFVNKSVNSMSVASNPHPTHTDYPEFDQFKSTFKGQKEYVFTFDKVGTWGYHNHMNSIDKGTVVVTE